MKAQSQAVSQSYMVWREGSLLAISLGGLIILLGVMAGMGTAGAQTERLAGAVAASVTSTPLSTTTGTVTPSPTSAASCDFAWHEVSSPSSDLNFNALYGVYDTAPNDIWVVGESSNNGKGTRTLIEHWGGERWDIVPSPNVAGQDSALWGVWAASLTDAWAVGYSVPTDGSPVHTLIIHWNGVGGWSIVPSPNPATGSGELYDIAASSANDIWAVGVATLHWDGTAWSVVTMPTLPEGSTLSSVSVLSATDAWAVGYTGQSDLTVTMHWNGTQWSRVASPTPQPGNGQLYSVTAIAANDVWAVGRYFPNPGSSEVGMLAMHWDGSQWSIATTPDENTENELHGVMARASNDVWAVGTAYDPVNGNLTLVIHWDGSAWHRVYTPSSTQFNVLTDLAAPSSGEIWAVGLDAVTFNYIPVYYTLVEEYSSTYFSDVMQGSTFYPYIKCLACLGIVSGYPDGTFRPNTPSTRGQLAKIISQAGGIVDSIPSNRQTFQDVAVHDTFWLWIERLAGRGVVNGYPCGGLNEPCGPNNLPYYRPFANTTRGQLTKIISNTAGFTDPVPAGQQTFTDVREATAFYTYTERLLINRPGVMSGYPCGRPNEPCDPQNRPYFRPGNNVTRGQSAKIASNVFFPSCNATVP